MCKCCSLKNLGFHIVTFAIQLHIKDWEEFLFICRNSAALVQWLCLVLQLGLSHLKGAVLQYQTQPVAKSGAV